jgi:hypothetical protein
MSQPNENYGLNPNLIRFYIFRKRMFQNYINQGHIGPILFPETIKNLTIEEINSWSGEDNSNYKYFLDTLAFLGLGFQELTEEFRNPNNDSVPGRLINSYKYFLRDDEKFNILFDKFMEMKLAVQQGRVNTPSNIFDADTDSGEETDTDADNRTITDSDPELQNKYVIPNTLRKKEIIKSPTQITISEDDEGFDLIEGDKKVLEYIQEASNNIVFVINTKSGTNKFFLITKQQLKKVIEDKTNIHYECLRSGPQLLDIRSTDVIKSKPLLKMTSIGLPIEYLYLSEIIDILESNKQLYLISNEPIEQIKAAASHDVLDQQEVIAGGTHCQYIEGDAPHSIYTLTYLDFDDIKQNNSSKRQRTIGGKRRTRNRKSNKKIKKSKRSLYKRTKRRNR